MDLSCARKVNFPLSDPQDLISTHNRIYVALGFYGRIQAYDQQGAFLFGFFVRSGGSTIHLSLDNDQNLVVVPARGGQAHIYDIDGTLLSSFEKKSAEKVLQTDRRLGYFIDDKGCEYAIRNRFFGATISKRNATTGKTLTTISTPPLLQPLAGPLPCLIMAICAALGHSLIRRRLARPSKTSTQASEGHHPDHSESKRSSH